MYEMKLELLDFFDVKTCNGLPFMVGDHCHAYM